MKVNIETLPALLAECGEMAAHVDQNQIGEVVKKLAARCALFAGVVGKMAEHIAELEKKVDALMPKAPVEKTLKSVDGEPANAEGEEEKAPDDLDAEVQEMARALNGGAPVELQEAAMQKGEAL